MDYRQNSSDSDSSKSEFKSHSFTDIPNMHHNHYLDWHPKPKPNEQQQKLDILLSYGVDEVQIFFIYIIRMKEGNWDSNRLEQKGISQAEL